MKIAIASQKDNLESNVSNKAGRAPYYLVFENKELVEKVKNPFAVGGGGAGFSVVAMLADKNIDLIVCANFGGNMIKAMKDKGIDHKEISNKKVKKVIEDM